MKLYKWKINCSECHVVSCFVKQNKFQKTSLLIYWYFNPQVFWEIEPWKFAANIIKIKISHCLGLQNNTVYSWLKYLSSSFKRNKFWRSLRPSFGNIWNPLLSFPRTLRLICWLFIRCTYKFRKQFMRI